MWRLIAGIAAVLLLCAQTPMLPGFPPGTFQNRAALDGGAAGCSDTDATAWQNAVIAASGTVSANQYTRVCTLIQAYKSASVWSLMDRVWLLAAENATQASIDLVTRSTFTIVSSPTFTVNVGYTGDNSSGINTNFTPSTAGGVFTQNSAHVSSYLILGSGSTNRAMFGANSGGFTYLEANTSSSAMAGDINGSTFPTITDTGSNGIGQYMITRTSASDIAVYKNGNTTPIGSSAGDTSQALNTVPIYMLSINPFGHGSDDKIAAVTIGAGMNSTQMQSAMSAMNAYQTAIGNNVY